MSDAPGRATPHPKIRLGLQANLGQFALLVAVNALVGGMVGQERTVLPLLANEAFGLGSVELGADVHRRVRARRRP